MSKHYLDAQNKADAIIYKRLSTIANKIRNIVYGHVSDDMEIIDTNKLNVMYQELERMANKYRHGDAK